MSGGPPMLSGTRGGGRRTLPAVVRRPPPLSVPPTSADPHPSPSAASAVSSAVYEGTIRHRRFEPVEHSFRYRSSSCTSTSTSCPSVLDPYPLCSARRAAPARFRRADFIGDPARPLAECARDAVAAATGDRPAGPVRLLTGLRYFGHSFNPVSLLLLLRPRGRAGRGGRRRRPEHPLGRAPSLRLGTRRAPGYGAGRRAREELPRLAADGHGPDLRLPRLGARREPRRPHRVAPARRRRRRRPRPSTRPSTCAAASSAAAARRPARPLPGDVAAGGGEDLRAVAAAEAEGRALPPAPGGPRPKGFVSP